MKFANLRIIRRTEPPQDADAPQDAWRLRSMRNIPGRITRRFDLDGTGSLTEAQQRARDLVDDEGRALPEEVVAAMELTLAQDAKVRAWRHIAHDIYCFLSFCSVR